MTKVEDFRSELRYRLILALDLEQEEEERGNVFQKLTRGLAKTRERLSAGLGALFGRTGELDAAFWDELEELFIMADVGAEATRKLLDNLRSRARSMGVTEAARFREVLSAELEELFPLPKKPKVTAPPEVVMMIGVNGVGKTTTIAKLAYRARLQGRKVLIAAGDTFRAAAIDQLKIWAGRVGAGIFAKAEGADPAAVAFEAVDHALKEGYDLVLLDTAGRLHTKVNLMEELRKIKRVLDKKHSGAPHKSVLVIDATTGQNALSQTKLFNEAVGVDEIVLTKLTARQRRGHGWRGHQPQAAHQLRGPGGKDGRPAPLRGRGLRQGAAGTIAVSARGHAAVRKAATRAAGPARLLPGRLRAVDTPSQAP